MLVETPLIHWHGNGYGRPIFAMDFQPGYVSGQRRRIATGGDELRIWLVTSNYFQRKAPNVQYRCTVGCGRHESTVAVARFSPSGLKLASADAAGNIFIWEKDKDEQKELDRERRAEELIQAEMKSKKASSSSGKPSIGSDAEVIDIEVWSGGKSYRGHTRDITSLAWSPDEKYFCSGSIDDCVLLFEVGQPLTPLRTLKDAEGFVLGVAWHPRNIFVCALSIDRTLRFYQAVGDNSRPVTKLSTLADGSTDKLYFNDENCIEKRQIDFSPDGNYLLTTAGVYKDSPCSYLYRIRKIGDKITKPLLVLPTPAPTAIARFCPRLFKLREYKAASDPKLPDSVEPMDVDSEDPNVSINSNPSTQVFKKDGKQALLDALPYRMVFAVGTGTSVLLYDTQIGRPFAQINGIHVLVLTDLSWSSDGRMLGITSNDGYCSFVEFGEGELGEEYDLPTAISVPAASEHPVVSKAVDAPAAPVVNILQPRRKVVVEPATNTA